MRSRITISVVGLTVLLAAVGCNNSTNRLSPTAPSPSPAPVGPIAPGATISGLVNSGSGLTTSLAVSTGAMTVSVAGTALSAGLDAAGQFVLAGVPAGDVELQFTAPSVDARLVIFDVRDREEIRIAVTARGNSATLESQHRMPAVGRVELEGRVTAIDATTRTLEVVGSRVSVPPGVPIRHGSRLLEFSDVRVGDRVHVKGTVEGAVVQASEVNVQSQNLHPMVDVEGIVAGLTGSCPSLTFTVNRTTVVTNGSTFFRHGVCGDIANGMDVDVKGRYQADGTLLAVQVNIEEHQIQVEVEGVVSGLNGTCPNLTFLVNGTTIVTNNSTRFERGGCPVVLNGRRVEVEGIRQPNGSVLARKVEVER